MKLILLMHLEEDTSCVEELLAQQKITSFSRFPMEGHSSGTRGWYGEVAPYRAALVLVLLSEEAASGLLEAVEGCKAIEDSRHPIRAVQLDVDRVTECLCA